MARDPILHITESNLTKVLEKLLSVKGSPFELDSKGLAEDILKNSKKFQLKGMYIIKSTGATRKKLEKTVAAESVWFEKFNGMLSALRMKAHHKNAKPITKRDSNYIMLKEVTLIALDFNNDFQFEMIEEGFTAFITTGIELMGKRYAINKFKYYKNRIYERYESLEIIDKDNDKQASKTFYRTWKAVLGRYASMAIDIESEEDYSHIVLARMEADEYKADYKQWITAQFEGLAFLDAIPSMNQLYGENAFKRYQKYTTTRKVEEVKSETIKFTSPEQEEYFRRLRKMKAEREENESNNK